MNICFACNNNYAPHLAVSICSLLKNADSKRFYDIIIMHKDISAANRVVIRQEARSPHVKVRFVDMSEYDEKVSLDVGVYYSVETNYRLFLFSELFSAYDRMIYLDCDTVVTGSSTT